MGIRHRLAASVALLGLAGALVTIGAKTTQAAGPCPVGDEAVSQLHYVIFDPDNTSHNAKHLRRSVDRGDEVHVLFGVPSLPAGCSDVTLSIVSYQSNVSPRHTAKLTVFSSQSQAFIAGCCYEMQVTIVPASGTKHFQIDFATGPVMTHPDYDSNLIDSASH